MTTQDPQPGAAATQLAARATQVAATFRNLANDILARAQAQIVAGEIATADFNVVAQRCLSLQAQALTIDNEAFISIADDVAREFSAIEDATAKLEAIRGRIDTAKEVITVATKVLQAAGAVASAILSPAAIPGAVLAVGVAVDGIVEATKGTPPKG
jgi:hypothetical protein